MGNLAQDLGGCFALRVVDHIPRQAKLAAGLEYRGIGTHQMPPDNPPLAKQARHAIQQELQPAPRQPALLGDQGIVLFLCRQAGDAFGNIDVLQIIRRGFAPGGGRWLLPCGLLLGTTGRTIFRAVFINVTGSPEPWRVKGIHAGKQGAGQQRLTARRQRRINQAGGIECETIRLLGSPIRQGQGQANFRCMPMRLQHQAIGTKSGQIDVGIVDERRPLHAMPGIFQLGPRRGKSIIHRFHELHAGNQATTVGPQLGNLGRTHRPGRQINPTSRRKMRTGMLPQLHQRLGNRFGQIGRRSHGGQWWHQLDDIQGTPEQILCRCRHTAVLIPVEQAG